LEITAEENYVKTHLVRDIFLPRGIENGKNLILFFSRRLSHLLCKKNAYSQQKFHFFIGWYFLIVSL